jgi:integrase
MKGIYRNGNLYWFSQMISGKRNCVSLETENLSVAMERAAELRDSPSFESGELIAHVAARYVKYCVETGDWTLSTERSKGYFLTRWAREMGRVRPREVRTEHLRAWHAKRLQEVSESTAYGNLMTIQGFFGWAKSVERLCPSNPVLPLTAKRAPGRIRAPAPAARKFFAAPAQRDHLIANAPSREMKYILYCGFHAGLRFNEIVESRAGWFDLAAGHLHLRKHEGIQFKDRQERSIPLTAAFRDFLRDDQNGFGMPPPADYMLAPHIPARRKNIYRYDFGTSFSNYMAAQGCAWITPHTMRHTFASLLASAGVSIYKIAHWMGDGVRVVERHYAKLLPNDGEIERAFAAPPAAGIRCPPRTGASTRRGSRHSQKG